MIQDLLLEGTNPWWVLPAIIETAMFALLAQPFGRRRSDPVEIACLVFLCALQSFVQMCQLRFIWDFLLAAALFMAWATLVRRIKPTVGAYLACIMVMCVELGKIVTVDLLMQPLYSMFARFAPVVVTVAYILSCAIVTLLAALVCRRLLVRDTMDDFTWPQMLGVLLPMIPFALLRSTNYFRYRTVDPELYASLTTITLALLLSMLVVIAVNAANLGGALRKSQMLQMQALVREQHDQYAQTQAAADAVRRQYHDIKQYLGALQSSTANVQDVQDFVDETTRSIDPLADVVRTGSDVLDMLLASKIAAAHKQNVTIVPYIDAGRLSFINTFDLCALFGNAIDNAIEAVAQMEHASSTDDREVFIKVAYRNDLAVICVSNPYDGQLRVSGGADWPDTTKDDAQMHGLGMRSIEQVAEKYGGAASYETHDGYFDLNVVIPLPQM